MRCSHLRPARAVRSQTHTGAVEPYVAHTETQQQFDGLKAFLKCYAPTCYIRLTMHPDSAKIPVTGLVCNLSPPKADGLLRWWCAWEQRA